VSVKEIEKLLHKRLKIVSQAQIFAILCERFDQQEPPKHEFTRGKNLWLF